MTTTSARRRSAMGHLSIAGAVAMAALPLGSGAQAQAALTCATLNQASGSYSSSTGVKFTLDAGDRVTVSSVSNATGQVSGASTQGGVGQGLTISFAGARVVTINDTASGPLDGLLTIAPLLSTAGAASISISCAPSGSGPTPPTTPNTPTTPGTPVTPTVTGTAATEAFLIEQGARLSASAQAAGAGTNISAALSHIYGRLGGVTIATRGAFGASAGGTGVDVWGAIDGAAYDGRLEGSGLNIGFGVQAEVSPGLVLGAAADYGTLEVETGGRRAEVDAFVAGPYLGYREGGVTAEAYLLYGRPDYDLGAGGTGGGERLLYGASISAEVEAEGLRLAPFAGLSGYDESVDAIGAAAARDAEQQRLSLGTRIDFGAIPGAMPYVTVGIDAYRFEENGVEDSGVAPTLGVGYAADLGAGRFSVDLNAAEVTSDVRRYGIGLRYDMAF